MGLYQALQLMEASAGLGGGANLEAEGVDLQWMRS
tara:strand:+ start:396 stop:500 length:105 start_codon:yes stop_codon:yes gene_type:complete